MTMDLQEALDVINTRLENLEKFCETSANKLTAATDRIVGLGEIVNGGQTLAIRELVKRTEELPQIRRRLASLEVTEGLVPTAQAIAALAALIEDANHRIEGRATT